MSDKNKKTIKISGVKFIKSFAGVDEYKLNNGFTILLKPNQNNPLLSWQVWYKVGSRNEPAGLTGIAHYLEHIMFKGTKDFRKGEIAQAIQLKGGIFNAFTSDDYTAYFENFAPENLELAIKIEADRMLNSRLDPDEIALERSVIVSELEGRKNNPTNILYETLKATAFQAHSYRNPVIGWRDDLDSINAPHMRNFYETYYKPDNAVAVLVGNFESEAALKLINKYFGKFKTRKEIPNKTIISKEPEQKAMKKVTIFSPGFTKQLAIAFHIPELNHSAAPALSLIADIVFNGMTSRLYPLLVDTGLAVDISAAAELGVDPGIFRIIVTVDPDADIGIVEAIINEELEKIKNQVSEEELKIAQAKEEAAFIYQADGVYEEGLQIGYYSVVTGDWTKYATWVEEINKVTIDSIKQVASEYFRPINKTSVTLLPEAAETSLVSSIEEISTSPSLVANYGAGTVEPLSPEKLTRLLKITDTKFSKTHSAKKIDFAFTKLNSSTSGIKAYFREDHNLPLTYLNAYLYAGSISDRTKPGLAFLTSEMIERGTKNKDKYQIAKLLDLYGSDISFESGVETAKISLSSVSKNLDKSIDLLSEMLLEPSFDPEELNRLKTELIAKLKQEEDNSQRVANREMTRIIYPENHPYRILTVEERINAINSISIEDIVNFYKENYNSNNLLISIVGDIDPTKAQQIIDRLFKDWNTASSGNNAPSIQTAPLKNPSENIITKDDKKQSEIVLAHSSEIDRNHPDFYATLLANYILGGSSLSSRLGTAVRDEHGYVYNIRSNFQSSLGAGMFTVVLGANPKNVSKAIKLSKDEITKFLKEGASATELSVAKSYLTGSFAARNLASNSDIADTLAQMLLYNLGDVYIKDYSSTINQITLEQVNAAARKHIHPEKLSTVVVGPQFE